VLSFTVILVAAKRGVAAVVVAAATLSCSRAEPDRRCVAASIFPLYDIVRRVAGDRLRVDLVLPPGRITHYYDPSPKEVSRLSSASLVFAVGLGLDSWLMPIVESAGTGQGRVFDLGPLVDPMLVPAGVAKAEGPAAARPHEDHEGSIDPHFWLDPMRTRRATELVVEACRNLDPEGGPGYAVRGDEVKASLLRLHAELVQRSARWHGRSIVTFHGAWPIRVKRDERDRALATLARVGGEALADRPLAGLSGGETQRAFLARASPTSLGSFCWTSPPPAWTAQAGPSSWISWPRWRAATSSPLSFVTHNLTAVRRLADRVAYIDGALKAFGPPDEVLAELDDERHPLAGLDHAEHGAAAICEEG
jgi:ABC-type Zn uptake system ZnuABC Zn-binding protein ZnuA